MSLDPPPSIPRRDRCTSRSMATETIDRLATNTTLM